LLFRISKIQTFASNSQPNVKPSILTPCCSEYQRYKLLRAIHNRNLLIFWELYVVQNIKDTNFCEQFTTIILKFVVFNPLFRISKIQTFASNSQPFSISKSKALSCSEYQRYKLLRAIHNSLRWWYASLYVVQNIKDTNFCEQFTTRNAVVCFREWLFRISKIQTFASNSQPRWSLNLF